MRLCGVHILVAGRPRDKRDDEEHCDGVHDIADDAIKNYPSRQFSDG